MIKKRTESVHVYFAVSNEMWNKAGIDGSGPQLKCEVDEGPLRAPQASPPRPSPVSWAHPHSLRSLPPDMQGSSLLCRPSPLAPRGSSGPCLALPNNHLNQTKLIPDLAVWILLSCHYWKWAQLLEPSLIKVLMHCGAQCIISPKDADNVIRNT